MKTAVFVAIFATTILCGAEHKGADDENENTDTFNTNIQPLANSPYTLRLASDGRGPQRPIPSRNRSLDGHEQRVGALRELLAHNQGNRALSQTQQDMAEEKGEEAVGSTERK